MSWDVDLVEPCHVKVYDLNDTDIDRAGSLYTKGRFHAFLYWTSEHASGAGKTPARAISQAYAARCDMWLGEVGESLHPASVIEPDQLIETSRWKNLWLAIPCALLLFLAWLTWRLA